MVTIKSINKIVIATLLFAPCLSFAMDCEIKNMDFDRIIKLENITSEEDVISGSIKCNFDDKNLNSTDITDKLSCNEEGCMIRINHSVDDIEKSGKVSCDIMLVTNTGREKYTDSFYFIKNDQVKITSFNDTININNLSSVTLEYSVNNLTKDELKNIEFKMFVDDNEYNGVIKDNKIIFSIPVSEVYDGMDIKIKSVNTGDEFSFNEKIHIVNEQKLSTYKFSKQNVNLLKNKKANISIIKYPNDYECGISETKIMNEKIASYSEDGYIYGKEAGETFIKSKCDGKVTIAKVTVNPEPVEIKFAKENDYIEVDTTKKIPIRIKNLNKDFKRSDIVWNTSDFLVANVDENGYLTAYNEGLIDIEMFYDGKDYKMTYNVIPKVEEIITNVSSVKLKIGQQAVIAAKTLPFDISTYHDVSYYVENPDILSIKDGTITAIADGKAAMVFKHNDVEKRVEIEVEKKDEDLSDFSLRKPNIELAINQSHNLRDTIISDKVQYEDLGFISLNKDICTVDAAGNVKALKEGTALICIKSQTTTQYVKVTVS